MNEKAKRIEEKLRELGINSIEELNAAIKRESLNISLMVCKMNSCLTILPEKQIREPLLIKWQTILRLAD